ncbi:MAG: ATP-binding protein [Candidatus Scalinduaceae bacterium]
MRKYSKDNIFDLKDVYQKLQRLATVINDSNDAVTLQDLEGNILAWNAGAEKMYGWNAKEALNMNIKDIVPRNKKDEELELLNKLAKGEFANSFETQRKNKDGKILDIWLTATVMTDEDNKPCSIATTERDITQIKSTENKLRRSREELLRKNKELFVLNEQKNKFLGIAAHDLRSPIVIAMQAASLLQDKLKGKVYEQEQHLVNMIKKSSSHLLNLVNDLLDVSKIESGRLDLSLITQDYQLFLKENVELMQILAAKKDVAIKIKCNSEIPPFKFDTERMKQVINNLLNNAIAFSPENTTINIVVSKNNRYVTTKIIDNGPGIPEGEVSKIFEEFYKNDYHSKGFTKSTGLGLAIVKKIIKTHGGEVGVESKEGKGASFYFTLPI